MNQRGKSLTRGRKARHGKFVGNKTAAELRLAIKAAHDATSGDVRNK